MDHPHTEHVGAYIRRRLLPREMSVTDAARALGVGRPALSNLLNGKASLSSAMAHRLAKTFGADPQDLFERQTASRRQRQREADRAVAAGRFVPPFLPTPITARQIEDWSTTIAARDRLPVLLRTLVHSTGDDQSHVDFPGNDEAQRPGWDGWVESRSATPWIPQGKSGWEFGVSHDVRRKADDDYGRRLAVPPKERAECTFVFVTPRKWREKRKWGEAKNAAGEWKAVRAFDASDLEQWLEQSIAGQVWLAEQLNIPSRRCQTLDRFWRDWRCAAKPRMTDSIFAASVEAHLASFKQWLTNPSDRPFYVAADSTGEALSFLACLFQHPDIPAQERHRAVVFESAETMRALTAATSPFIPIACDDETERELVPLHDRLPCIVVHPRNSVRYEPDIALDLLGQKAFRHALADMGVERDAARLARESGRSPTILRRRLSTIDAIRMPQWANDRETARGLIPLMLAGAWHAKSNADCQVLSDLTGGMYDAVEANVTHLLQFDDPPVWSVGQYRGVASQIDALFAISPHLIENDIDLFLKSAKTVLSELDPALELPENQRWAAAMHGKVRDHSEALRKGVCETLALLAINGNERIQQRLGIDVSDRIASLISELLNPLTLDKLLSHDRDFPLYAEAAPDQFLDMLEHDLHQAEPTLQELLRPAPRGRWFDAPRRTGLLWALECLAWSRRHFPRVIRVLARLATVTIDDNWWPKPNSSLQAIFHPRTPQTTAPLDERIKGLKVIANEFPSAGWQVCVRHLRHRPCYLNHRPRWRDGGSGYASEVSGREEDEFIRAALELALAWPEHDEKTLGDLIENIADLAEPDRSRVWNLVDDWAALDATERAKASLRERIFRAVWSRGKFHERLRLTAEQAARRACARLASSDPVIRHGWLFAKPWVAGFDDAAEHSVDDELEWSKRTELKNKVRSEAMAEIWAEHGWKGVARLLSDGDASDMVGRFVARSVSDSGNAVEILGTCLRCDEVLAKKLDGFMLGFINELHAFERSKVLRAGGANESADQVARLFRCAPPGDATWRVLEQQTEEVRDLYWRTISPPSHPYRYSRADTERPKLIEHLLQVQRPRAAFRAVGPDAERIETSLLKRLLSDLATVHSETAGSYRIDPHDLSDALSALDGRSGVSRQEIAALEYAFIEATGDESDNMHGIPNLERAIADDPAFFASVIFLLYERDDHGEDPPGLRLEGAERHVAAVRKADTLLNRLRRIPGLADDGTISAPNLYAWCVEVRRLCAEQGRSEVGDVHIGELLSHAPSDRDGRRPCGPVCEVLQRIASPDVASGFCTATLNARGAHWRGMEDGGDQERELAASYRAQSRQFAFEYPYVSAIFERIAAEYEREGTWYDSDAGVRKRIIN